MYLRGNFTLLSREGELDLLFCDFKLISKASLTFSICRGKQVDIENAHFYWKLSK